MTESERWSAWIGRPMYAANGVPLGPIVDIYVDEQTNRAEWATVETSPGGDVRFVPLEGVRAEQTKLVGPWEDDVVETAPALPYDGALTEEDEAELFRHYGPGSAEAPMLESTPDVDQAVDAAPSSDLASDPALTATAAVVTRSEEELRVTKVPREAGRVRLRKWVETEEVSQVVPVSREEVRVERQPITAANVDEALAEAELTDTEYELVLHEEEVVAAKVTVPKERIRVEKAVVTTEQPVEEQLLKERVDVERDDATP